ncbi:dienelactone hydrolase family protein [Jannaschia sp. M317]|uniref:dienelactone hydrolase family protein n=1 Tax=Jannaschia sp. M317 TaxID=2867011 RepID=UPI0021A524B0|nr:dienelactone hydrolase family protein [Jannaschia sp. M317]UWQ17632.1 dienelactone hydrolase family protein [Jannaschia sp. M317]
MGERHEYFAGEDRMSGYRARPEVANGAALLVLPAFAGLREFEMAQCDHFAALGYEVLGVDYYGDGWATSDMDAAGAAMAVLNADRHLFLRRTEAALAQAQGWAAKVGAMGFCLGGKGVLDLARAGHLDAAVSLHGVYDAPPFGGLPMPPVLLCHGWNDPLATPAQFVDLVAELEAHSSDWHALTFGQTGHAFTNPARGNEVPGMGYHAASARRTQAAVETFLAEQLL